MAHRQTIQHLPMVLPAGHETIHQGNEVKVVSWFKQVHHFVDNDVLQSPARLQGKFRFQADRSDGRIKPSGVAHQAALFP